MLIIFDLDGTLFQAKPVILLAVRRLLQELYVPVPEEMKILQNAPKGALPMLEALIGEEAGASLVRYEQIMHDVILETGELFPCIPDVMEQLVRDGHELIVCSNSPEAYVSLVLEHTGIAKWVAGCYSSEAYPSKAALIGALIGETHGKNIPAVVVGDTHGDVEAAHVNGLPAIAAMYGYGNADMLSSADGFAHSAGEIVTALRSPGVLGKR
jgi:phosphoglycolate phosphatase